MRDLAAYPAFQKRYIAKQRAIRIGFILLKSRARRGTQADADDNHTNLHRRLGKSYFRSGFCLVAPLTRDWPVYLDYQHLPGNSEYATSIRLR